MGEGAIFFVFFFSLTSRAPRWSINRSLSSDQSIDHSFSPEKKYSVEAASFAASFAFLFKRFRKFEMNRKILSIREYPFRNMEYSLWQMIEVWYQRLSGQCTNETSKYLISYTKSDLIDESPWEEQMLPQCNNSDRSVILSFESSANNLATWSCIHEAKLSSERTKQIIVYRFSFICCFLMNQVLCWQRTSVVSDSIGKQLESACEWQERAQCMFYLEALLQVSKYGFLNELSFRYQVLTTKIR